MKQNLFKPISSVFILIVTTIALISGFRSISPSIQVSAQSGCRQIVIPYGSTLNGWASQTQCENLGGCSTSGAERCENGYKVVCDGSSWRATTTSCTDSSSCSGAGQKPTLTGKACCSGYAIDANGVCQNTSTCTAYGGSPTSSRPCCTGLVKNSNNVCVNDGTNGTGGPTTCTSAEQGQERCFGSTLVICSNGSWDSKGTCTGEVGGCSTAGTTRCSNSKLQVCDGTSWRITSESCATASPPPTCSTSGQKPVDTGKGCCAGLYLGSDGRCMTSTDLNCSSSGYKPTDTGKACCTGLVLGSDGRCISRTDAYGSCSTEGQTICDNGTKKLCAGGTWNNMGSCAVCGNGRCEENLGESRESGNCPSDCGGNGSTQTCTTNASCTQALGSGYICQVTPYGKWCVKEVSSTCGNNKCDINETVGTCPIDCQGVVTDCGTSGVSCGTGLTCQNGMCVTTNTNLCGNNVCDAGENKVTCPRDCGYEGSGQTPGGTGGTGGSNTGDSCTAQAGQRCGSNGQCCANGGVCQGTAGQEVCQIPSTSPAQQCADGGGTCSGYVSFQCDSLKVTSSSSGQPVCEENAAMHTDRDAAISRASATGCGQFDQVCVGGTRNGQLCGDFTIYDQCSSTPGETPPPGDDDDDEEPVNYFCNSLCDTDAQCQTSDSRFRCSLTEDGNRRCRLSTNSASTTCQAPVGPMCMSISMARADGANQTANNWKPGDAVRFTCGTVQGASRYVFRVIKPDDSIVTLNATGAVSAPYTLDVAGRFRAQCQICTGPNADSCLPFEDPNSESVQ